MTHEDDIPELVNRLEGRLESPNPEGIRAEASRRKATRRRTLTAAGICAVVLAVAGGVLWSTRDTTTETGPETQTPPPRSSTPPTTGPPPLNATGRIIVDVDCINFTQLLFGDQGWFIVSDIPDAWQGRPSFDVDVELDPAGGFIATDGDGLSATFHLDIDEAQAAGCTQWKTPTPIEDLPTIDALSADDCIAGFMVTARSSTNIAMPEENETAWASFQSADDWEGRTDVCWISISTETTCRSYAWFRTLGVNPGKFQEDPPLNAKEPCVGGGKQFG